MDPRLHGPCERYRPLRELAGQNSSSARKQTILRVPAVARRDVRLDGVALQVEEFLRAIINTQSSVIQQWQSPTIFGNLLSIFTRESSWDLGQF